MGGREGPGKEMVGCFLCSRQRRCILRTHRLLQDRHLQVLGRILVLEEELRQGLKVQDRRRVVQVQDRRVEALPALA